MIIELPELTVADGWAQGIPAREITTLLDLPFTRVWDEYLEHEAALTVICQAHHIPQLPLLA